MISELILEAKFHDIVDYLCVLQLPTTARVDSLALLHTELCPNCCFFFFQGVTL